MWRVIPQAASAGWFLKQLDMGVYIKTLIKLDIIVNKNFYELGSHTFIANLVILFNIDFEKKKRHKIKHLKKKKHDT